MSYLLTPYTERTVFGWAVLPPHTNVCPFLDAPLFSTAAPCSAKERVMLLVDSEHKEVQRHALQCVSKIMVSKWEFIR